MSGVPEAAAVVGRFRAVKVFTLRLAERAPREWAAPHLRSSADAFRMLEAYFKAVEDDREHFVVVMLNTAHRATGLFEVTTGTLNLCLIHPRDVFRPVLVASPAASVVVAHNHPGGDPAPSEQDVALTRQLVKAGEALGVPVLDHVIVGAGRYYSFADARRMAGGG